MALDQLPGCTFFRLCIFAKVPALLFVQQSNVIMSLRADKYFFVDLGESSKMVYFSSYCNLQGTREKEGGKEEGRKKRRKRRGKRKT